MRTTRIVLAGAAITLALLIHGTAASASEPIDSVQSQIDQVLNDFPGGHQISSNQISWDNGAAIMTFPSTSARAVGTCATGQFCAYSAASLGGVRLAFTSCSAANSTASLSAVRSVANGRSSGTVTAYNGSSAVFSVSADSWTNTSSTVTRLGC